MPRMTAAQEVKRGFTLPGAGGPASEGALQLKAIKLALNVVIADNQYGMASSAGM